MNKQEKVTKPGDRLRSVRKSATSPETGKPMTQAEFAEFVGIGNEKSISAMEKNHRTITEKTAKKVCDAFPEVRLAWLLYGDGDETIHQQRTRDLFNLSNSFAITTRLIESMGFTVTKYYDVYNTGSHKIMVVIESPDGTGCMFDLAHYLSFQGSIKDIINGLIHVETQKHPIDDDTRAYIKKQKAGE